MVILNYTEHMQELFDMEKLLIYPSGKNEEYHESLWNTREIPFKRDIIR